MKDKGILFRPDMAQVADEGRKGQTRRIIKPQPVRVNKNGIAFWDNGTPVDYRLSPYAVGQRMYLKETHYRYGKWRKNGTTKTGKQAWRFKAYSGEVSAFLNVFYDAEQIYTVRPNSYRKKGWYKRSALFMPKKFARKWFVVTEDPVPERLQDINEADAIAEGALFTTDPSSKVDWCEGFGIACFVRLWNSIYGPDAWALNPWVWVVTFKKMDIMEIALIKSHANAVCWTLP